MLNLTQIAALSAVFGLLASGSIDAQGPLSSLQVDVVLTQDLQAAILNPQAIDCVPSGAAITGSFSSSASLSATQVSDPVEPCVRTATSFVSIQPGTTGGLELRAGVVLSASGPTPCDASGMLGLGEAIATFSSPTPVDGFLRVQYGPVSFSSPTAPVPESILAVVDVFNDGVFETGIPVRGASDVNWIPVTLDSTGVPVFVQFNGSVSGSLSVEFLPAASGSVIEIAPRCGPQLSAAWVNNPNTGSDELRVAFRNAFFQAPNSVGNVLAFGSTFNAIPLPGAGCFLHLDIVGSVFFPNVASGVIPPHTLTVPVLPSLSGVDFLSQGLSAGIGPSGLEIRTTETLRVQRP
ncbi:MAG: hypothetical protein AAF196_15035 [Planctomycetota bacterium]